MAEKNGVGFKIGKYSFIFCSYMFENKRKCSFIYIIMHLVEKVKK